LAWGTSALGVTGTGAVAIKEWFKNH
jgi:hypothetical protein